MMLGNGTRRNLCEATSINLAEWEACCHKVFPEKGGILGRDGQLCNQHCTRRWPYVRSSIKGMRLSTVVSFLVMLTFGCRQNSNSSVHDRLAMLSEMSSNDQGAKEEKALLDGLERDVPRNFGAFKDVAYDRGAPIVSRQWAAFFISTSRRKDAFEVLIPLYSRADYAHSRSLLLNHLANALNHNPNAAHKASLTGLCEKEFARPKPGEYAALSVLDRIKVDDPRLIGVFLASRSGLSPSMQTALDLLRRSHKHEAAVTTVEQELQRSLKYIELLQELRSELKRAKGSED